MGITVLGIRKALKDSKAGRQVWLSEPLSGGGSLALVARRGTGFWYFRYSPAKGANVDNLPLGAHAEDDAEHTLTLSRATERATRYSALLRDPETRDIRAHLERQRNARETAERELKATEDARSKFTLGALLGHYVDFLDSRDAASAKGTRSALNLHIKKSRPELAAKPAHEVTADDIADIVASLKQKGKRRTAGLVRSHLSAAFNLGRKHNTDAPEAMRAFDLKFNPVQDTKSDDVDIRDRVLPAKELRAFLAYLDSTFGAVADLIRACLLLGGQRPQQIARTTIQDFDAAEATLRLWDLKGKRRKPRKHMLPLCIDSLDLIQRRVAVAENLGTGLLFTSEGKVPVRLPSISKWIADAVAQLIEAGDLTESFQMRDLRRTAETQLAAMRIPSDVRSQVQSHGISGIQSQRYDRHDYMIEKRETLEQWEAHLAALRAENEKAKSQSAYGENQRHE